MLKVFIIFYIALIAINFVDSGVFSRNNDYRAVPNGGYYQNSRYNGGRNTATDMTNNGPSTAQPKSSYSGRSGLSAWGIITLILLVILLGMVGYYGILCYPLICRQKRRYSVMDSESTSSGTPTGTSDFDKFEKCGDYSSRSTTPSKSHEGHDFKG